MEEQACKCRRCHRALKNEKSKAIGYGPVCAVREAIRRQHDDDTRCKFGALNRSRELVCLHDEGPSLCTDPIHCKLLR
jgi:hypothetical protein